MLDLFAWTVKKKTFIFFRTVLPIFKLPLVNKQNEISQLTASSYARRIMYGIINGRLCPSCWLLISRGVCGVQLGGDREAVRGDGS
jgi:hypothetical protein